MTEQNDLEKATAEAQQDAKTETFEVKTDGKLEPEEDMKNVVKPKITLKEIMDKDIVRETEITNPKRADMSSKQAGFLGFLVGGLLIGLIWAITANFYHDQLRGVGRFNNRMPTNQNQMMLPATDLTSTAQPARKMAGQGQNQMTVIPDQGPAGMSTFMNNGMRVYTRTFSGNGVDWTVATNVLPANVQLIDN